MAKVLALILAVVTLSSCSAEFKAAGPAVTEPRWSDDHWLAADGSRLPVRAWMPAGSPRAVVLALHGMNDYSNAFDGPGKALAARGIAVYAYDQRGFGAGPHPGWWSSTETMADDARTAIGLLHTRHPGVAVVVLGESMGGAVAIEALKGANPPAVAGLILSAPAVWGRSSMGVVQRAALWLSYQIAPGWTLTGRGLKIRPSDNIEMLIALSRDPLVIKGTRVDAIHGLVDLMDAAEADIAALELPVLALYGANDEVIPPEPAWDAIARLPHRGAGQRAAYYPNGWHMLLRDLQARVVLDDIAAWIADPAQPLPSGADRLATEKLVSIESDAR